MTGRRRRCWPPPGRRQRSESSARGCAVLAKDLAASPLAEVRGRAGAATARAGVARARRGRERAQRGRARAPEEEGESREARPESSASNRAVAWTQLARLGRSLQQSRPSRRCFGMVAADPSAFDLGNRLVAELSWHGAGRVGRPDVGAPQRLLPQSRGSGRQVSIWLDTHSPDLDLLALTGWVTSFPSSRSLAGRRHTRTRTAALRELRCWVQTDQAVGGVSAALANGHRGRPACAG